MKRMRKSANPIGWSESWSRSRALCWSWSGYWSRSWSGSWSRR
jgi:hypothetical protein